jgi:hypothetical protein
MAFQVRQSFQVVKNRIALIEPGSECKRLLSTVTSGLLVSRSQSQNLKASHFSERPTTRESRPFLQWSRLTTIVVAKLHLLRD